MFNFKPSISHLMIFVLFLAVTFFGYKKCNDTKALYKSETGASDIYSAAPSDTSDVSGLYGAAGALPPPAAAAAPSNFPTPASTNAIPTAQAKPSENPDIAPKTVASAPPSKSARPAKDDTPTAYGPESRPEFATKGNSVAASGPRLFITSAGTKLRAEPNLKAKVLGKLPLFAEVYYQNEVSDKREQLSIGKEVANEPWVKVKTGRGTVGWVYGAYVNYYKEKRNGTW